MSGYDAAEKWLREGEWSFTPEGWIGPTLDYGNGEWTASVFPGIDPDGYEPDPTEATGATPALALFALMERLASVPASEEERG